MFSPDLTLYHIVHLCRCLLCRHPYLSGIRPERL